MNNRNVTDMSVGSPFKHIMKFAFPLIIGNLFQQLYSMVDSVIVGKFVSNDALAAVGTCGSINFLFFSLCSGLAVGIGVIVAQYFGAKDEKRVSATIANAIYILTTISLSITAIGITIAPFILRLLQTPDDIIGDSILYLRTYCTGIIAITLYNGTASILRALGDSRTPLYFLIISSLVNVGLDLTFVLAFKWGVFGVGFATVVSQFVSAIGCIWYAYKKVTYFKLRREQMKPDKKIILQTLKLGIPVGLQSAMIATSMMVLQGLVNSFGKVVMSSYTITCRIEMLIQQPYGSIGMALTTFTGQNVGAGKIDRVQKGFRQGALIVLVFSLTMLPIMYLFGESIVGIFVDKTEAVASEVISLSARALRITSLCYFGLGMIYVPRGVLNGSGDTGFSLINGISEVFCRVAYSQGFSRIPKVGFWSIWITTGATWATVAVVCCIRYASGVWKRKAIK